MLIRVLRLQKDNPLVWQRSLIDSEVDSILAGRAQRLHAAMRTKSEAAAAGMKEVPRREVTADDTWYTAVCLL